MCGRLSMYYPWNSKCKFLIIELNLQTGGGKLVQHYTTDTPLKVFEAFAGIGTQRMALNNLNLVTE